jgi:hypothetical protein
MGWLFREEGSEIDGPRKGRRHDAPEDSASGQVGLELETDHACIEPGDFLPYALFFLARRAEGCQKVSLAAQLRSLGKCVGARRSSALLSAAALLAPSFDLACHGALPLPP